MQILKINLISLGNMSSRNRSDDREEIKRVMRPGVNNDIPRSPYNSYKNVYDAHVRDIRTEMRISQPNLQA